MRTTVIAHRGARSLAPENTLVAARKGRDVGADLWETDVAVTADGELILFHDDSLARTTNAEALYPERAPWTFSTFRLEEIRRLDAGSWFGREDPFGQIAAGAVPAAELASYQGERVPTLREALQLTKDLNWRVNLELKRQPPPQNAFPLVEGVLALIDEVDIASEQVILSSFNHEWLHLAQRLRPDIEVQALVGYSFTDPIVWEPLDFGIYNARYTLTTPDDIQRLKSLGIAVNLFTVNDPEDWVRFITAGIAGIITDFPQDLLAMLDARAKSERLITTQTATSR
jgi:glycerophosphoryl diester phosphodiesterase